MIGPPRLHRYTYADYVTLEQTSSTTSGLRAVDDTGFKLDAYQSIPSLAEYVYRSSAIV